MHTFEPQPTEPLTYQVWTGSPIMVDGHIGTDHVGPDCNLTGEPMVFDDVNSRYALKARAVTAQQIDGFHL